MATKGKKSKEIGGEMSPIPFYYMLFTKLPDGSFIITKILNINNKCIDVIINHSNHTYHLFMITHYKKTKILNVNGVS